MNIHRLRQIHKQNQDQFNEKMKQQDEKFQAFLSSFGKKGGVQLLKMELAHAYQIPGTCDAIEIDYHKYYRKIVKSGNISRCYF